LGVTNQLGIRSAVEGIPIDQLIDDALRLHGGHKGRAARSLGISRWALAKRLRARETMAAKS
jgi:DNA-binding NtrC family response regulator